MKGVPVQISGLELPVKCYARFFAQKLQIQDVRDAIGEPKEAMLSDPACTHAGIYAGISAVGGGYDIIRASAWEG